MRMLDLQIRGTFTVTCPEHGVVAQRHTYTEACLARREHVEYEHAGETKPSRALTARGTCSGCGRDLALLPDGTFRAHDIRIRRKLTPFQRRTGVNPVDNRGRCPGSHQRPARTTPPEPQP